jgi:hypothetical protein
LRGVATIASELESRPTTERNTCLEDPEYRIDDPCSCRNLCEHHDFCIYFLYGTCILVYRFALSFIYISDHSNWCFNQYKIWSLENKHCTWPNHFPTSCYKIAKVHSRASCNDNWAGKIFFYIHYALASCDFKIYKNCNTSQYVR